MNRLLLGSALAALIVLPAHAAVTFTSTPGYVAPPVTAVTFEDGPLNFIADDALKGFDFSGLGATLAHPPTTPLGAVPFGDPSNFYLDVQGGDTATLQFPGLILPHVNVVRMFIGSLDTYNSLTFTTTGGTFTIDGTTLLNSVFPGNASNSGNQTSPDTNREFSFFSPDPIQQIVFASSQNSFEVDDLQASGATPEPATWLTLLLGFAGLGFLLRRRPALSGTTA